MQFPFAIESVPSILNFFHNSQLKIENVCYIVIWYNIKLKLVFGWLFEPGRKRTESFRAKLCENGMRRQTHNSALTVGVLVCFKKDFRLGNPGRKANKRNNVDYDRSLEFRGKWGQIYLFNFENDEVEQKRWISIPFDWTKANSSGAARELWRLWLVWNESSFGALHPTLVDVTNNMWLRIIRFRHRLCISTHRKYFNMFLLQNHFRHPFLLIRTKKKQTFVPIKSASIFCCVSKIHGEDIRKQQQMRIYDTDFHFRAFQKPSSLPPSYLGAPIFHSIPVYLCRSLHAEIMNVRHFMSHADKHHKEITRFAITPSACAHQQLTLSVDVFIFLVSRSCKLTGCSGLPCKWLYDRRSVSAWCSLSVCRRIGGCTRDMQTFS